MSNLTIVTFGCIVTAVYVGRCWIRFGFIATFVDGCFFCVFRFDCVAGNGLSFNLFSLYTAGAILRRLFLYCNASARFSVGENIMMALYYNSAFTSNNCTYQKLSTV